MCQIKTTHLTSNKYLFCTPITDTIVIETPHFSYIALLQLESLMHELKSLDYCFVKEDGGGYTSEGEGWWKCFKGERVWEL